MVTIQMTIYVLQNCQQSCYRKELLRECGCVDTVYNGPDEARCGYADYEQGQDQGHLL